MEIFDGIYVLNKSIEFLLHDHKKHHFYYLWHQKEVKLLYLTVNMYQLLLRTI